MRIGGVDHTLEGVGGGEQCTTGVVHHQGLVLTVTGYHPQDARD